MSRKRIAEPIANDVWIVRGGFPNKPMSVYLLRDKDGGVIAFDAGIRAMAKRIKSAASELGGLSKIVLGHSHADHRGAAPALDVPVYCHELERPDAEGDGGSHYFDYSKLNFPPARYAYPHLIKHWDGGPVEIAGTLTEGDMVGEFEVVHVPGHAPGQIVLWRERDRLALTSDCFYVINPETGQKRAPGPPHPAFNHDQSQVIPSVRKLAELRPYAAWPGHEKPLLGDVQSQLEEGLEAAGA